MKALTYQEGRPLRPGYARRTGPTSCQVAPLPGMHLEDLRLLRRAGLIYGRVLPYRMDVSLDLWGEFIDRNWRLGHEPRHCTAAGDFLAPDDAAAFLKVMPQNYPSPEHRGPHMTSI